MNVYQLATIAGQQIKVLNYEEHLHEKVMGCLSAKDVVTLWANFLIDNRDHPDFRLRVFNAGLLPALIQWANEARDLLNIA